jgi:hypothetical protein
MMKLVMWGVPILLGFMCGFFFTLPVNIAISAVAGGAGGWMLWSTRNHEIGALVGVIAMFLAGIFLVSLWVTIASVSGFAMHVDLSWLLRLKDNPNG